MVKEQKIWYSYKNGNYNVAIFGDGTKIRISEDGEFHPKFPENIDICITHKCDGNCSACYDNATVNGKHASFGDYKFFETLRPYTEIAINGNDLSHPQLVYFLKDMQKKNVIVNMTVNQRHFNEYKNYVMAMLDSELIKGLGISLNVVDDTLLKDLSSEGLRNAVVHVIAGIVTLDELNRLASQNIKILILGYKTKGRGVGFYERNKSVIEERAKEVADNLTDLYGKFKCISFDNLALKQLNVRNTVSNDVWEQSYMGDDGVDGELTSASMYIDLVDGTFSRNSTSTKKYKIMDNIDDMFKTVLENK